MKMQSRFQLRKTLPFYVFLFIGVCMSVLTIVGSLTSGISWDEEIQMNLLHGLRWASDPGNDRHFGIYGLSFLILGHALAVVLGLEPLGETIFSPDSFYIRHIAVAILAMMTAIAVGWMVYWISRSRVAGAWAFAALMVAPVFVGHAYFNTKDIPVAAGYTLFTLALVWYLKSFGGSPSSSRRSRLGQIVLMSLGIWLSVGTRFAMVYPLVLTIAVLVVLLTANLIRQCSTFATIKILTTPIVGLVFGVFFVSITNPCLIAPITDDCQFGLKLIPEVFSSSLSYPMSGGLYLFGQSYSAADPPFWFLPTVLFAGFPLLMGILAVAGLIFYWENAPVSTITKSKSKGVFGIPQGRYLLFLMGLVVSFQALLIPMVVVVLRGTIYDMQRQHLYVYPALVCLSALGLVLLWQKVSDLKRWGIVGQALVGAVAFVALAVPMFEIVRLFPYSYVYVNPAMTVRGFQGSFDSDYWGASLKEAYENAPEDLAVVGSMPYWVVIPFARGVGQTSAEGNPVPLRPVGTEVVYVQPHRPSGGLAQVPADCQVIHTVTRPFRGEDIPLSYVAICPASSVDLSFRIA